MNKPSTKTIPFIISLFLILALSFCLLAESQEIQAKAKTIKYSVSLKAGSYEGARTVKLSSEVGKLKIYYTTDGSKPTTKSTKYTSGGIKIKESCTLRLLIKKKGYTSVRKSIKYTIRPATNSDFNRLNELQTKTYYSLLSENEQRVYELIFGCCLNLEKEVGELEKYNLSYSEFSKIFHYMICENPQLFYVNDVEFDYTDNTNQLLEELYEMETIPDSYVLRPVISSFSPKYTNTAAEIKSTTKKLQKAASDIISRAKTEAKNDFELIRFYHDEIDIITTYDSSELYERTNAGTDDALVYGTGLCSAYARAFCYLCQLSDIPCVTIEGTATTFKNETEGHAWNKVQLEKEWYNVDVCWDDKDFRSYMYLCLTDKAMGLNHTPESKYEFEELKASATKYNYFNYYGYTENMNSYDTKKEIISSLAAAINGADSLKKGEYLYAYVYYYPSAAIQSWLSTELDSNMWSALISEDYDAYIKLYSNARESIAYKLVGYSSAVIAILLK